MTSSSSLQNQHGKMKPWLAVHGVSIAFSCMGIFALFGDHQAFTVYPASAGYIAAYFVVLSLYIYCFMAVHSLYEKIRENSNGLVTNVLTAGSMMPTTIDIPEKTQPEAKDFNYVKLV